jgi:aspartate aminotransferase/aminotransferase
MITGGVAGGLMLSMLTLLDQTDSVLIPDPYFICYESLGNLLTTKPAYYELYPDFRVTEQCLEAGMHDGVKALILNSPSNPTGRVLDESELKAAAIFARRHDLPIISDEIYEAFSYEGTAPSILSYYDQVVLLGGFGKTYGMPGWRLGYAVGPQEVIDRMRTLQQFSYVCAPTPGQYAALRALDVDMTPYIDDYRMRRDRMVSGLSDVMAIVQPSGAFYVFPKAPGSIGARAFADLAVTKNLLVVPGPSFSRRDTHIRLSYALPDDKLSRGIALMRELVAEVEAKEDSNFG